MKLIAYLIDNHDGIVFVSLLFISYHNLEQVVLQNIALFGQHLFPNTKSPIHGSERVFLGGRCGTVRKLSMEHCATIEGFPIEYDP